MAMKRSLIISILFTFCLDFLLANTTSLSFNQLSDSIKLYRESQPEKSLEFTQLLYDKGILEDDNQQIGKALRSSTMAYFYLKEYEKAQIECKKFYRHAKQTDNQEMVVNSLIINADISMILSEVKNSVRILEEALQVANSPSDELLRQSVLSKLAALYDFVGDTDKAIKMRKQTLIICKNRAVDSIYTENVKSRSLANCYVLLASSFLKKEEIDSSVYYNEFVREIGEGNDSCLLIYYYSIKGEVSIVQERFLDAKQNFEKSLEYCAPDYDLFDLNMAFRFGKVAFGLKNFEETIHILADGLKEYSVVEAEEAYMDEYYKLLADSYKEQGNFKKANYYFEKYINTQEKLEVLKGDISSSLKTQEIKNFQLELDQKVQAKELEKIRLYYIALACSISIIILLLILLRFYRSKKRDEVKFTELLQEVNAIKASEDIVQIESRKTNEIGLSEDIVSNILTGLSDMKRKEFFLKKDCTLYNVAKKIKTNTSYLSKVINAKFNKNFNNYLNDLRVDYAIVRLKEDDSFRLYSIQGIAEELGYKSADSFTKYFKRKTGLNPSFYIKQLDNL